MKDGTVTYLKALGLSANKIVLGIAAYGRSYLLQDSVKPEINAPTTGNGFSGAFTKINGLLSFYEVKYTNNQLVDKFDLI